MGHGLTMLELDEMTTQSDLILDLQTLNQISHILNQATDVHSALNTSLAQLVDLMGMETGWVFVRDEADARSWTDAQRAALDKHVQHGG